MRKLMISMHEIFGDDEKMMICFLFWFRGEEKDASEISKSKYLHMMTHLPFSAQGLLFLSGA